MNTLVRALAFVIALCFVVLIYQAAFAALAYRIDSGTARIEAQLRDQDGLDPKQLIQARRLPKW